jgi:hypothetical protein
VSKSITRARNMEPESRRFVKADIKAPYERGISLQYRWRLAGITIVLFLLFASEGPYWSDIPSLVHAGFSFRR